MHLYTCIKCATWSSYGSLKSGSGNVVVCIHCHWISFLWHGLPLWASVGENIPSPASTRCPRVGCYPEGGSPSLGRRGGVNGKRICKGENWRRDGRIGCDQNILWKFYWKKTTAANQSISLHPLLWGLETRTGILGIPGKRKVFWYVLIGQFWQVCIVGDT